MIPFPAMWFSWSSCGILSKRFLVDSSASTMHACFTLQMPEELQVSLYLLLLILQSVAASIGISNFFRALSSFGFSIAHFCFSFRSAAFDISPYFWPQVIRPGFFFCLFVNRLPDHVYPSGGFSYNMVNRVKPVHASDRSRSASMFQ